MSEKTKIQERLKDIASELAAMLETDEQLTDEQEELYTALEVEADTLTEELNAINDEELKKSRREKADEIRAFAKASTRVTSPNQVGSRIGRVRAAVEDDPKRGFRSLAHFATRVLEAGAAPRNDDMLMQVAAGTGLSQGITADGGVFFPPAFSKTIWDGVMARSNSLLDLCDKVTFDTQADSLTVPAKVDTNRTDGNRQGGVQGYWKSELSQMQSSQMKFREVTLTPHELYVFSYVSDKMMRNAPVLSSQLLEDGSADEIAFKIGDSIINGDGVGKPKGIVGHAATVSVAKETGQPAATILQENVSKMLNRLHVNYQSGAVWLVNQDCLQVLQQLKFEVGTGGVPVFLPPGGLSDNPYSMLYGKPVIPIEYCSTLGTVGDIILCNLRAYAAAIKGTAQSAYSMHLKFDYAQTAFRVIFEIDGQPWLNAPVTPFKGSATTSPIVTLATRS